MGSCACSHVRGSVECGGAQRGLPADPPSIKTLTSCGHTPTQRSLSPPRSDGGPAGARLDASPRRLGVAQEALAALGRGGGIIVYLWEGPPRRRVQCWRLRVVLSRATRANDSV
eukprot:scaffold299_cov343-Prasinococcus_capsulatus_cf.AAC.11